MSTTRSYTTRRQGIVNALAEKLKTINGTGNFFTDLSNNVVGRLLFWDEVDQFPAVHINAGSETREYQGGGYKDRFLTITLSCYVNTDNAAEALDELLEDVETVLEDNDPLTYTDSTGASQSTAKTTILSVDTDEGVLEPLGVGEVVAEIQY